MNLDKQLYTGQFRFNDHTNVDICSCYFFLTAADKNQLVCDMLFIWATLDKGKNNEHQRKESKWYMAAISGEHLAKNLSNCLSPNQIYKKVYACKVEYTEH